MSTAVRERHAREVRVPNRVTFTLPKCRTITNFGQVASPDIVHSVLIEDVPDLVRHLVTKLDGEARAALLRELSALHPSDNCPLCGGGPCQKPDQHSPM